MGLFAGMRYVNVDGERRYIIKDVVEKLDISSNWAFTKPCDRTQVMVEGHLVQTISRHGVFMLMLTMGRYRLEILDRVAKWMDRKNGIDHDAVEVKSRSSDEMPEYMTLEEFVRRKGLDIPVEHLSRQGWELSREIRDKGLTETVKLPHARYHKGVNGYHRDVLELWMPRLLKAERHG